MPSVTKLARLARLAALPETRRAVIAAARSEGLRDISRRAATDRAALARDLMNPANARELFRTVLRHPASRELGSASLMFMPGRYLGLSWAATWAAHRIMRKYVDPPVDVLDAPAFGRTLQDVTPRNEDDAQPEHRVRGVPGDSPRPRGM